MKLNDISIKAKLSIISALFIITFLVFAAIYYVYSREITENSARVYEECKVVDLIWMSNVSFEELVMPANDYLIDFSPEERVNFDRISKEVNKNFDKLKIEIIGHEARVVHEPEEYQKELEDVDVALHEMMFLSEQILNSPVASSSTKDTVVMMKRLDALALNIKEKMVILAQVARADIDKSKIAMNDAKRRADRAIVVVSAFMVLVAFVLEIFVRYFITRRIKKLVVGASEFSRGNFDYVIENGNDELGKLAEILDEMANKIKKSQTELVQRGALDMARHDLLKKLGSSLEMGFTMQSIAEAVLKVFPDVVVSYTVVPMGSRISPNVVAVHVIGKIGERYLREVKESILLGLETLPSIKTIAPSFDKWKISEFVVNVVQGERSTKLEDSPKSSVNIPLVIPQSIAGIFNFSSRRDGVFGETEINTLYSIVSSASETIERLKRLIDDEQKRMTDLVESIGDGILVIDRNWNIVLVNKAATTISGFAKEDIIGRYFSDVLKIFRERDREKDLGFIEKAMVDKVTQSITEPMVMVAKDGREVPIGDSAAPFIDHTGEVVGAIIVFRDITKERETQAIKSDFAYASHQLRTPVSKAMWNLEAALGSNDMDQLKSATHVAYDSMKSVQKLSEELIDVSRIDKGEIIVEKERVAASDIITGVVSKVKKLAEASQVELVIAGGEGIEINTSKKLLTAVLLEVLNNAVIYNHKGGRVEIKTQQQDGRVLIEVIDIGIGITGEHSPLIFTKFFRGSNFDTTAIAGAGLGLYIAKAYTTLLRGKIWFTSEEGKGTTFSLSIPIE